jgi:RES domain
LVKLPPPPPKNKPNPCFYTLLKGAEVYRIFDPSSYNTTALTFRSFGPLHRFDHHRGKLSIDSYEPFDENEPCEDSERSIYYTAPTFSSCLVECFGDQGIVEFDQHQLAVPTLLDSLKLLDIRKNAAMRAGANAALSKNERRALSQSWSRYFYEQKTIYPEIQGIFYYNAHNDEESIALYECAERFLYCSLKSIVLKEALKSKKLRRGILKAAIDNNLKVKPSWLQD